MYGHHGSKAAGNMIGHLLGYDLKERGVPIAMIHVRPKSPFVLQITVPDPLTATVYSPSLRRPHRIKPS